MSIIQSTGVKMDELAKTIQAHEHEYTQLLLRRHGAMKEVESIDKRLAALEGILAGLDVARKIVDAAPAAEQADASHIRPAE